MDDKILREHLRKLLSKSEAHVDWADAVKGFPQRLRGEKPAGAPHSAWELLEHTRIAQSDILEFCRNPKHVSPEWPSGYWPERPQPKNAAEWDRSVRALRRDLGSMVKLVTNSRIYLAKPIRKGGKETILREALLVADHNSYHLGQFVELRKMLGCWPET